VSGSISETDDLTVQGRRGECRQRLAERRLVELGVCFVDAAPPDVEGRMSADALRQQRRRQLLAGVLGTTQFLAVGVAGRTRIAGRRIGSPPTVAASAHPRRMVPGYRQSSSATTSAEITVTSVSAIVNDVASD